MILRYRANDAPDANGRIPESGDRRWRIKFPLEGGIDYLEVIIGKIGREVLLEMLQQEESEPQNEKVQRNQLLVSAYRRGTPPRILAKRFKLSINRVYVILREHGLVPREHERRIIQCDG